MELEKVKEIPLEKFSMSLASSIDHTEHPFAKRRLLKQEYGVIYYTIQSLSATTSKKRYVKPQRITWLN